MIPKALDMETRNRSAIDMPILVIALSCEMLALLGILLFRFFNFPLGQDQAINLLEAQRYLAGAELYGPHLAEPSPPLIIWFSTLPHLLGRLMHGSPSFLFRLVVTTLIFLSVTWCVRILRRSDTITNLASVGLLACAILAIEFIAIGRFDFGQREHLIIILIFPYVLAVASRAIYCLSSAERCILGVAAGVAVCFKPQYALIPIALELLLAFSARSLRRILTPEVLSLLLSSTLVVGFCYVFARLYFT